MKGKLIEKLIVVFLYILLAVIACATGVRYFYSFVFDDILNYYHGGVLKFVIIIIMTAGIILPIIKYRKHQQKWILPLVLCLMLIITPIFNDGILKHVEDDLRVYSREKWDQHKNLRIYMLDNLETHYLYKGKTQEEVKALLGEPDVVESEEYYEYFVNPGFMDSTIFYIQFEDGTVVATGKRHT